MSASWSTGDVFVGAWKSMPCAAAISLMAEFLAPLIGISPLALAISTAMAQEAQPATLDATSPGLRATSLTDATPGAGTLPDDFPAYHVMNIPLDRERRVASLPWGLELPLAPFFGVMGVAPPRAWKRCTAETSTGSYTAGSSGGAAASSSVRARWLMPSFSSATVAVTSFIVEPGDMASSARCRSAGRERSSGWSTKPRLAARAAPP